MCTHQGTNGAIFLSGDPLLAGCLTLYAGYIPSEDMWSLGNTFLDSNTSQLNT